MPLLGTPIPSREGWALRVRRLRNGSPGASPERDAQHLRVGVVVSPERGENEPDVRPWTPGVAGRAAKRWVREGLRLVHMELVLRLWTSF